MSNEDDLALGKELIKEMREAFARGDWNETTALYERIAALETDRAMRLEATCLAARALAVVKDSRAAARHLLKTVTKRAYKKPVHYEFLARAHLDLKQYKDAAEACTHAEELRVAEAK